MRTIALAYAASHSEHIVEACASAGVKKSLGMKGVHELKESGKVSQNVYVFPFKLPYIVSIPTAIPMLPTKPEVEILLSENNIDYGKAVALLDTGSSGCFLHRSSPMLLNAKAEVSISESAITIKYLEGDHQRRL